jgi:putative multiple sugar transport system ATP-binding protein
MAPILEMKDITKRFPGVIALRDVNLSVREGEIHAICGENGAGKSTLMKVLSGVHPYGSYGGQILYQGEERRFARIADSEHLGIIIIHQELALAPQLSIAENIFLGNEVAERGVIDWNESFRRARDLMRKVGLKESPNTLITNIGVGKQQLVEIAKALSKKVKLLILDEPTASLNEADSAALLNLLLEFKAQGMTSILISHKLNEIAKIADSITILRDGATVETIDCRADEISEGRIIRGMVGREMAERYPPRASAIGDELFSVRDWRVEHPQHAGRAVVKGVSLHVNRGEVVGIAGLMGAGRTEFAMSVFGGAYGRNITGTVTLDGRALKLATIDDAIASGLAYVTEDRKSLGLILNEDIKHNITLAHLEGISERGVINDAQEQSVATRYRAALRIRSSSIHQRTLNLSGGNQQKVVLSKWLFAEPKLLMLDEPTRGIDVGAKYEIYTIINDLAAQGKGVIVISSEMPELLGICDRIYVMNEGRFVDEMPARDATQEKIMASIMRQYAGALQ